MKKPLWIALAFLAIIAAFIPFSQEKSASNPSQANAETEIVVGYYERFTRTLEMDADVFETFTCDTFVVRGLEPPTVVRLRDLVARGNTVNTFNDSGDLRMNIDLRTASKSLADRIRRSSEDSKISIGIKEKPADGKGAHPCYSFVEIEE